MSRVHVLLPSEQRSGALSTHMPWLVRGERLADAAPGYHLALRGFFSTADAVWPAAALIREALYGDAGDAVWLGADLAYVQPDLTGARLLACGHLDISREQSEALAAALKASFEAQGLVLEPSLPSRWHVRVPHATGLAHFDAPEQVLGDDLLQHLPRGDEARRWRVLLTEAQVLLHQHPVNTVRRQRGQVPANSLWFWGGGALPAWVRSELGAVYSDEPLVRGLALRAGVPHQVVDLFDDLMLKSHASVLLDLERQADPAPWWPRLEALWRQGHTLLLAAASGARWQLRPWHRWRVWRRRA